MGEKATDEQLGRLGKAQERVFGFAREGKRPVEELIQATRQSADDVTLPSSPWYASPVEQLRNVRRWRGVGHVPSVSEGTYWDAESKAKHLKRPRQEDQAWVLTFTLEHPDQTLSAYWHIIKAIYPRAFRSEVPPVWQLQETSYGPSVPPFSLTWQLLDLRAHIDEPVSSARSSSDQLASWAVLAAAAHFPRWLEAIHTQEMPSCFLGGINLVDDEQGVLVFHALQGNPELYRLGVSSSYQWYGVPRVLEVR